MKSSARRWKSLAFLLPVLAVVPYLAPLAGATEPGKKSAPAARKKDPVDILTGHLGKVLEILKAAALDGPDSCGQTIKKLDAYVKKVHDSCERARRQWARLPSRRRRQLERKGWRQASRIIQRYTTAVARFDRRCPRHTHRLEEVIDELVAGPGKGPSHHRHHHKHKHHDAGEK